ncbi:MAG: hypothetical protein WB699_05360 [Bacteroidota bacterium]
MTDQNASSSTSQPAKSLVSGSILIVLGLLFLAANLTDIDFSEFWPVVFLIPSIIFFIAYARDRSQFGLLMPATILLVFSLPFFISQHYGWDLMSRLWPFFMLGPGLGFIVMYLLGRREPALLIPASILTGLSAIFFLMMNGLPEYWPAILILIGLILLLRTRKTDSTTMPQDNPPAGH